MATVLRLPTQYRVKRHPNTLRAMKLKARVLQMFAPLPDAPVTALDLYTHGAAVDETDPMAAVKLYTKAIELARLEANERLQANAYTNRGNCYFRMWGCNSIEVHQDYREAIDLDSAQPEAHYNLGYVLLAQGRPVDALERFQIASDLDPDFADAHYNAGMALRAMGRRLEANASFRRYLELEPVGEWSDTAREYSRSHLRVAP